jgi:hypothetical protein
MNPIESGGQMTKHGWINFLLVLSLVMAFMIVTHPTSTASAALVRPVTLSWQDAQAAAGQCILTPAEFHSLHGVYIKDENIHLLETDTGPLGFEGGLSALNGCK